MLGKLITALAILSLTALASPTRPASSTKPAESPHWKQTAQFLAVRNTNRGCVAFRPPQAISERAPLGLSGDARARLNFVITRDGDVGSIVVLHLSSGDERDLIGAVMGWRFRPAMCDGVPTDAEADVELQASKR